LEAFSELLRTLPLTGRIAYVLVQHLDPTHRSLLSELLGRTTKLPVTEITDQTRVQANNIYVIPPNCDLTIQDGILKLTKRKKNSGPARSIDHFLQSLALDQKENAIGVILSGAGSDGAKGLKAIKTAGGVTFAQDATSAKYDSMPRSAVGTGCVDFVLPPSRIAKELARMLNQPGATRGRAAANARNRRGRVPRQKPASPGGSAWPAPPEDLNLRKIFLLLRTTTGIDFGLYRSTTINRRIGRRMGILKIKGLEVYFRHLRENPAEVDALYQDLLLNVTSFFRNPGAFEALKRKVFPKLVKNRQRDEPLRIWVAGCSTGQEAYSLAIAYAEFAEKAGCDVGIQIFATDVNAVVLETGRCGRYTEDQVASVSAARLRQFFAKENDGYRVQKAIRDVVIFAQHNLVTDPPFTRVDLITCRNLLIYFEAALQQRIIPSFHYALKPGGYLMLGASESVGQFTNFFEPHEKAQKVFVRKPGVSWLRYERPPAAPLTKTQPSAPPPNRTGDAASADVFREADRISLSKYAPPTLVITELGEILQFRGDVQKYLDLPTGRASFNLLKMAREGLGAVLQRLLNRVRRENRPVREKDVPVGKRQGVVTIQMVPLKNLKARYYLVVFEKVEKVLRELPETSARTAGKTRAAEPHRVAQLKVELVDTREQLHNLQEEYDTSVEELQASNEEVQSSNEELQSLNEELETSNEELESANEELTTLNEELATRNTELRESERRLREQAELLELAPVLARSTKDRIIFWNRGAEQLYGFTKEEALGQTAHLLLSAQYSEPLEEIRDQLNNKGHWEGEVWHRRKDGRLICVASQWLMHYDSQNKPRAILEVGTDITSRRAAEEALRESEEFNKSILESSPDCIQVLDLAGRLVFMSPGGREAMEVSDFEAIANTYWPGFWEGSERTKAEQAYHQAISGKTIRFQGCCKTCAGASRWWDVAIRPILGADRRPARLLVVSRDITEQKQAEFESQIRARLTNLRAEIASELMGQKPVTAVLQRLTEILVQHVDAAFARIWTLSEDASTLELRASAGLYTHINGEHSRVKVGDYKIGRIAAGRKPHLTNDVANDNEISSPDWAKREGMVSFAGYPLAFQGELWGVIALFAKHALEPHVLKELELTADVIAQFLQRKQSEAERERLYEEATAARNEAIAASRAKDDFLAALSHELRTPLNPVLLLASEGADDSQLTETVRNTFRSIRNNVSLEARLIDDLLDLTRIAHGKLTLELKPVDVQAVVREAVGIVVSEIEEKRIELSVRFHSDRTVVMGDAVRLQQVFWNVLKNAVKFTPAEGKISIDTVRDMERQKVIVRIIDNGIGLSDSDLDRIFNAFSQAQPRNGGLGLGLTISRRLVENLGGTIRARSAGRNRGATFEIELPLANHALVPHVVDGSDRKTGKDLTAGGRLGNNDGKSAGLRILLIEDHEQTRTTLQRLLTRRKFHVTVAASAEEARRVAAKAQPEILISDLGLPDGDGYSLFEELRELCPDIVGIALSGYGMDDDIARSREVGFAAHLTKPIDISSLTRTLAALTSNLRSSAGRDGAGAR
jgi:two-component system, chemotaxis family, CheB/CheR fusion protein